MEESGVGTSGTGRTDASQRSALNRTACYDLPTYTPSTIAEPTPGGFIPAHGGYEHLLSFKKARIIYDATVKFCDRFIDKRSRTRDQMIQAARSGKQNILEGSQASGSSKDLLDQGGLRERMTRARLNARAGKNRGRTWD